MEFRITDRLSLLEKNWVANGMAVTTFVLHKRRKIKLERQLVRVFLLRTLIKIHTAGSLLREK